jgi:hypothetical protein
LAVRDHLAHGPEPKRLRMKRCPTCDVKFNMSTVTCSPDCAKWWRAFLAKMLTHARCPWTDEEKKLLPLFGIVLVTSVSGAGTR